MHGWSRALITVTPCDKHGNDIKKVSGTRDNNCLMLHAATMVEVLTEFSALVKSSDTEREFEAKLTIHNSTVSVLTSTVIIVRMRCCYFDCWRSLRRLTNSRASVLLSSLLQCLDVEAKNSA